MSSSRKIDLSFFFALTLHACSFAAAQDANVSSGFVRFLPGVEQWSGELQTAINSYTNDAGVKVDLVAAVHIGDISYYQQLNEYFADQDVVLYELVADPDDRPGGEIISSGGFSLGLVQSSLANFLDISFQLEQINYRAENFRHADLSPSQLQEIMLAKGENFFSMFLSFALAQLASEQLAAHSNTTSSSGSMLSIFNALLAEDRSQAFKYLFAEELSRSEGMMIGPELEQQLTILGDRNRIALEVLAETLKDESIQSVSLFYGAAHMAGMERELLQSLGFRSAGQRWLSAWQFP